MPPASKSRPRVPTATARGKARRKRRWLRYLIAAVPAVDATLEGTARSTLGKMTHELATLHQKVVQAAKRRDDTLRRQFERTRALAFPGGEPQERAIGLVWLLNRIGPALPEILDRELPVDPARPVPTQHWVLSL